MLIKMSLIEMYSRARVGKNSFDRYPIWYGLKQGDALTPLLFNFVYITPLGVFKKTRMA